MQTLIVDDRERAGGLIAALARVLGQPPAVARLPLGDVRVGLFVFERKSVADLAASLLDGRFASQLARLRALPPPLTPGYLLEGELAAAPPGLDARELEEALCVIQLDARLPLLRTRNVEHSAALLAHLARRGAAGLPAAAHPAFGPQAAAGGGAPRRSAGRPPGRGVAVLERTRLQQIRGVGPALAERLLARFQSLHGLLHATPEELAALPGLSAEQARRILEHLRRG